MARINEGLENLFSATVKTCPDLMACRDGTPGGIKGLAQLQHRRPRGRFIAMEQNHSIGEIALMKGA